ncbi:MAG: hypothetical protein WCJ64_13180 [Rhodospirillaceae bacterium]
MSTQATHQILDTPMSTQATHQILDTPAAAKYLGKSESWLKQARVSGRADAPRFRKIGRSVRYTQCDLDTYLAARTFRSTTEARAASPAAGA